MHATPYADDILALMTIVPSDLSSLIWLIKIATASLVGGVVGSISGLGGGIVIVPVLTTFLDIPIQDAIGASIVSVIAVPAVPDLFT
jgi:uncharacterized membrane protein YfcA